MTLLLLLACARHATFSDPAAVLLAELDRDGSGDLARDELPREGFGEADTDHDDEIDLEELRALMERADAGPGGPHGPGQPPGRSNNPPPPAFQ